MKKERKISMTKKPSDLQEKFMVRMPDGMREKINDEAKKNNRSMNAEIVFRLEESFKYGVKFVTAPNVVEMDIPYEQKIKLLSDWHVEQLHQLTLEQFRANKDK